MTVLHLISGDLWAGAENQFFNLVIAQHRRGDIDVHTVLFNEGLLATRLRENGVPVTVLDEAKLGGRGLLAGLAREVRRIRPDILHSNRYKENVLGSLAGLACSRTACVRTVHGAPEFTPRITNPRKYLPHLLDRFCARFLQRRIVCVADQLLGLYEGWIPADRLVIIPNGVDLEALKSVEPAAPLPGAVAERTKVLFVGRFYPVKRIDVVLEIARALQQRAPGRFVFHLFGDGPLRPALERQATEMGLHDVVHFMGFTENPAAQMRHADALLITSDHEGLPMNLLEALYMGVQVVSHAVGAIPRVLDNGRLGTLIHGQDPAMYADALMHLSERSAAERSVAADASRRHVAAQYSSDQNAARYLEVYRDAVAG